MKKYIMGGIIGAVLMLGGVAVAATQRTQTGLQFIEYSWQYPDQTGAHGYSVSKWYDTDNNTLCYIASVGISCLKNN